MDPQTMHSACAQLPYHIKHIALTLRLQAEEAYQRERGEETRVTRELFAKLVKEEAFCHALAETAGLCGWTWVR